MTALPIVICDFWRNRRGESVRIQICEYKEQTLVDCRVHYTNADGKLTPSHHGLAISIRKLPELLAGLRQALSKAHQLGLIEVQGQIGTRIRTCICNWFSEQSLTDKEILDITARLPDRRLLRIPGFGRKSLNELRELQHAHYGPDWEPPPRRDWDWALPPHNLSDRLYGGIRPINDGGNRD